MNQMNEEVNEGISKYTIKNLNLQKEPSKSAMIIKVIPAYSRFELLDSYDEWLKVSFNHREGYVAKGNVSVTKITTATTRLKTRPLKESKSMKTIKKHQVVEVVDQEGVFNQVFYEGKLGYVEADLLSDDGIKYQPDKLGNFYYNAEKFVNDRKIKSPTPFLVVTDLKAKQTYVFEDVKGSWKELYCWPCSIGAAQTPTITGVFHINGRKESFKTGRYQAKYATKIKEGYYYHSVLYDPSGTKVTEGRLGEALSHGCIRLAADQAKWIYDAILDGTTVVIH
ncbi:MAG: L,D-transpeptidase family protein [Turicibacter sp.]|nr:L,D-transpeptidase family protein [Turicibacter sp.]